MLVVTTFVTSVLICICLTWIPFLTCLCLMIIIKYSMCLWHSLPLFIFMVILLICSLLQLRGFLLFSLKLAGWQFSALVSHQMDLGCLWVICHLLDVPGCSFGTFHFLGNWCTLLPGNLFKSVLLSLMVLSQTPHL